MSQPSDIKPTSSDSEAVDSERAQRPYEAPKLTELGSVRELTRGETGEGSDNATMASGIP